jgi:hypothetical protein
MASGILPSVPALSEVSDGNQNIAVGYEPAISLFAAEKHLSRPHRNTEGIEDHALRSVMSCGDDTKVVAEGNEINKCRPSGTPIAVNPAT